MGRHIVKQPNGKLAIFSTIVDNFIITDATPEEYIQFRIAEETQRIKKDIAEIVVKLDAGKRPTHYHYTWEEALECLERVHGKDELDKLLKEVQNCKRQDEL